VKPGETTRPWRLLNPGPVTLTPRVRGALVRGDLCHREPEFAALQLDVRARLQAVYPEAAGTHVAIMLTGSGTAAVEAMVGSCVPKGARALVVANGVYGDRMAAMLAAQGKEAVLAASDWLQPMNLPPSKRPSPPTRRSPTCSRCSTRPPRAVATTSPPSARSARSTTARCSSTR
jgi:2-aminoethylphosphonate-pyruvate transaminase